MAEFGTGKTIFVLAIVVGCFAILWPKIFYPMLISSINGDPPPATIPTEDASHASLCCDVIFETDVNAIKVLTEMCGDILHQSDDPKLANLLYEQGHLPKSVVARCRDEVYSACGLDITAVIKENVKLTKNYKQILDEIRTYNNSACLKRNFGVQLSDLGTPRQMRMFQPQKTARHLRPERPPHLHPDMLHPALREKGRAIPQQKPISVASVTGLDGSGPRPGHPMPGMRPPMGGAGHVVPAPKGSGTMGIVMPLYTVGIVIFFVYTIMRMLFKKTDDRSRYPPEIGMDPELRRMMFGAAAMEEAAASAAQQAADAYLRETQHAQQAAQPPAQPTGNGYHAPAPDTRPSSKLGDAEMDQLRKRLEETEAAMERIVAQMGSAVDPRPSLLKTVPRQEDEGKDEVVDEVKEEEEIIAKQEPEIIALPDKPEISERLTEEETPVAATELEEVKDVTFGDIKPEEPTAEVKEDVIADLAEAAQDVTEDKQEEEEEEEEEVDLDLEVKDDQEHVEDKAINANGHVEHPERTITPIQQLLEESGSGLVTVLGMETTARCEGGQRWHERPPTPSTPPRSTTPLPLCAIEQFAPPPPPSQYRWARPPTPPTPPRSTTPLFAYPSPHAFLLESAGMMQGGHQHGILVSDSECEATRAPFADLGDFEDDEEEPPVILSGKMTLSVISLPDVAPAVEHASAPASPALSRRMFQAATVQQEEPIVVDQGDDRVKAPEDTEVQGNDHKNEFMSNGSVDEPSITNYTTASAAAAEEGDQGGQEETSADISGIDDEHAEAADIDEPAAEVEDLPRDEQEPTQQAQHGQSNGLL